MHATRSGELIHCISFSCKPSKIACDFVLLSTATITEMLELSTPHSDLPVVIGSTVSSNASGPTDLHKLMDKVQLDEDEEDTGSKKEDLSTSSAHSEFITENSHKLMTDS